MRQEDGRNRVRYRSSGERNVRWLESSKQLNTSLATGGRRWDERFGVENSIGYLYQGVDVIALSWLVLAEVIWHLDGKPAVPSWRRNGDRDGGGRNDDI